jgi:hypothetical protein
MNTDQCRGVKTRMEKIKMTTPLVEMDGDEMTRILWRDIKEELLLPYIELKTEYYDLGLSERERTKDQVTTDSAHATRKYGWQSSAPPLPPTPSGSRNTTLPRCGSRQRHHPGHSGRHGVSRPHYGKGDLAGCEKLEGSHYHRPPRLR